MNDLPGLARWAGLGLVVVGGLLFASAVWSIATALDSFPDVENIAVRSFLGVGFIGAGQALRQRFTSARFVSTIAPPSPAPVTVVKCRECGQANATGANYCQHCGTLL